MIQKFHSWVFIKKKIKTQKLEEIYVFLCLHCYLQLSPDTEEILSAGQ